MRTTILVGLAVAAVLAGCSSEPPATGPAASPSEAVSSLDPAARRYVDAVASADLDALVASFAPDALIVDVGRVIHGHDAIREWAGNEVIGGRLVVLRTTPRPGGTTMLVRFQPNGGGGFEANYDFEITGQVITKATLSYA
jgi:hypothetical protein